MKVFLSAQKSSSHEVLCAGYTQLSLLQGLRCRRALLPLLVMVRLRGQSTANIAKEAQRMGIWSIGFGERATF